MHFYLAILTHITDIFFIRLLSHDDIQEFKVFGAIGLFLFIAHSWGKEHGYNLLVHVFHHIYITTIRNGATNCQHYELINSFSNIPKLHALLNCWIHFKIFAYNDIFSYIVPSSIANFKCLIVD